MVGILLTVAERGVAQSEWGNPPERFRLTVRPEMATGTRTLRAGSYLLDRGAPPAALMPYDAVVVPEQCVGRRRCPLVVWFGDQEGVSSGDGPAASPDNLFKFTRLPAERYGMIFLAPRYGRGKDDAANLAYLSAALQYVLDHFAIDPDKIAIAGRDGDWAAAVGINNLDVFSRIVGSNEIRAIPDTQPRPQPRPQPRRPPEYLNSMDRGAGSSVLDSSATRLRERGFRVQQVIHFLGHEQREENFAFTAHWLHESWAYPDPATRPTPPVVTTLPLLTPQALTRLTTFWTRVLQEPDSIRRVARQAHLREVAVQLGSEQVSTWLTDMAALAAQYPSVAAALKAAGLSAQQHDAYRLALWSVYVFLHAEVLPGAPPELAKNVEFVRKYPRTSWYGGPTNGYHGDLYDPPQPGASNELEALHATKMFRLP